MLNDAGPEQFSGIYIRPGRTDCRKGARGLSEMIQFQLSMSPYQKNVLFGGWLASHDKKTYKRTFPVATG